MEFYFKSMEDKILIKNIDFNCNLAQTAGDYSNETETGMIEYMSSLNIACGFHAGDPLTIKKVLEQCRHKNKVIGAHIGFPANGAEKQYDEDEIEAIVLYQIGAIASFAKAYSLEIEHVRLHGKMRELASENLDFALSVAKSIQKFSKWLIYYGEAGNVIENIASELDINVAREIYLNKNYTESGFVDKNLPDFENTQKSIERLKRLLETSEIDNTAGSLTKINFDTIHFGTKAENAVELAKEANAIIVPKPVNYNRVVESGWV